MISPKLCTLNVRVWPTFVKFFWYSFCSSSSVEVMRLMVTRAPSRSCIASSTSCDFLSLLSLRRSFRVSRCSFRFSWERQRVERAMSGVQIHSVTFSGQATWCALPGGHHATDPHVKHFETNKNLCFEFLAKSLPNRFVARRRRLGH